MKTAKAAGSIELETLSRSELLRLLEEKPELSDKIKNLLSRQSRDYYASKYLHVPDGKKAQPEVDSEEENDSDSRKPFRRILRYIFKVWVVGSYVFFLSFYLKEITSVETFGSFHEMINTKSGLGYLLVFSMVFALFFRSKKTTDT